MRTFCASCEVETLGKLDMTLGDVKPFLSPSIAFRWFASAAAVQWQQELRNGPPAAGASACRAPLPQQQLLAQQHQTAADKWHAAACVLSAAAATAAGTAGGAHAVDSGAKGLHKPPEPPQAPPSLQETPLKETGEALARWLFASAAPQLEEETTARMRCFGTAMHELKRRRLEGIPEAAEAVRSLEHKTHEHMQQHQKGAMKCTDTAEEDPVEAYAVCLEACVLPCFSGAVPVLSLFLRNSSSAVGGGKKLNWLEHAGV
ncbi:hypothetical protein cyc_01322 [Cyclospora cayetanensis]|uniref:Uncharacterized protein n=1 Tax=Cyclospora cayetanensis TaxID=88456 RepID=A0A1D3CRF4_9EIME|nr:hypothetical protein cyc_01322 [Cyclospora cayetanensis]